MTDSSSRLANWQVAVVALWSLGGTTTRQHTEDVAVKCWELARGRFSWERHSEHPNLDTCRVVLSDAKKLKNGRLVAGNQKSGWLLTRAGIDWIEAHRDGLSAMGVASRGSALRAEDAASMMAVESHRVFHEWRNGSRVFELYELTDAVQLPADAPRKVIRNRVEALGNADDAYFDTQRTSRA